MVLLRYLAERYRHSELYTEEGEADPALVEPPVDVVVNAVIETAPVAPASTAPPAQP